MSRDSWPSDAISRAQNHQLSRRSLFRGLGAVGGAAVAASALSACGGSSSSGAASATSSDTNSAGSGTSSSSAASGTGTGSAAAAGGTITFGSNYSDAAPKASFAALMAAAKTATGISATINTTDHNTFQNNITSYLQGTPDDLFTWFAGYRLQQFAAQGLLAPVDDVWQDLSSNFSSAAQSLSKGADGKYYLVPIYNYPWVVFYNKSTFKQKGYQIPTTWDAMISLCKQMQKDGLIPFALGQKDGWPALGTFDILNMRINGYDYHMQLMQHKVAWTDSKVTDVFNHWAELMPYCQNGATGRIWEDAAKTLEQKQAGMLFQGTNQVAAQYVADGKDLSDLDFFVYPEINSAYAQDYMDAPTDGFCLSAKAKDVDAAKSMLKYLGTAAAEATFLKTDHWDVAIANNASTSAYNAIQKKSVEVIKACKNVAQFADRDSDSGFADNTLAAAVDQFINSPTSSTIQSIQKSLEAQAKAVFTS